jgi:hypothetical protein
MDLPSKDHLHQVIWKDADFQRKVELVWLSSLLTTLTLRQGLAHNSFSQDATEMPTDSARLRNARRFVRIIQAREEQRMERDKMKGLVGGCQLHGEGP